MPEGKSPRRLFDYLEQSRYRKDCVFWCDQAWRSLEIAVQDWKSGQIIEVHFEESKTMANTRNDAHIYIVRDFVSLEERLYIDGNFQKEIDIAKGNSRIFVIVVLSSLS